MKMITVKLNGQEVQANLLNSGVARRFENGIKTVVKKANEAKEVTDGPKAIEMQCKAVIDFVDDIFGVGSAKKVFGDETDLLTCLDVFKEITELYEKQVNPLVKEYTKRMNPVQ